MDTTESADLIALLPHRPPFRFVDVVDRCEPGRSVAARWRTTPDAPWTAAHFPGRPIVPGVLLLEALAQAGALAVLAGNRGDGSPPLLAGVDGARFRRPVVPGAEVVLEAEVAHLGGQGGWGRGRALVEGVEVARGRVLFVLG